MPVNTERCLVIAEAGVNHNGSLELALSLVDAAADAGADVIKFQTFRADKLASIRAEKAPYQQQTTGNSETQLDMLRRLELSAQAHEEIIAHCRSRGIVFMSSPFDEESLHFLVHQCGVGSLKLGSGELTNAPLLVAAGRSGRPVLLSTGMATLAEVRVALSAVAFGCLEPEATPSQARLRELEEQPETLRTVLSDRLTLLHCTTEYPSPVGEVNLRAMETMRQAFGLRVGYSDHTQGIAVGIAAVACGASVLEKHLTLDRNLPGPDHAASLEPGEMAELVQSIRMVEAARGDGVKRPQPSEMKNIAAARKSIVVQRRLKAGQRIAADDIAIMRPGDGRSPFGYWDVIGTTAERDMEPGEKL